MFDATRNVNWNSLGDAILHSYIRQLVGMAENWSAEQRWLDDGGNQASQANARHEPAGAD